VLQNTCIRFGQNISTRFRVIVLTGRTHGQTTRKRDASAAEA